MASFEDKLQALMGDFYSEWQKEENKSKGKWDVLGGFSAAHQIAVAFGNFNYQVENGGIEQWISNGYFHDDAEKLIEYLKIGAKLDERCQTILENIYRIDQYAQETECDREGYYYDEDGENCFIGDMINSDTFDTWYYAKCDGESWWQVVSGIIDKVEGREPALVSQDEHDGETTAAVRFPIQVYIENAHDESIGGFTFPLPTALEGMQSFLDGAEITGWQEAEILRVRSDVAGLEKILTDINKKTKSPEMLDELNYLAAKIAGMDSNEHGVFTSALEARRHCGSIAELINLTENLDRFDLQPAFSEEHYGEFLLEVAKDNTSAVFDRLERSEYSDERDLAKYIIALGAHVDEAAYGRATAERENGAFTKNGYLTEASEFKMNYRGSVDIPDEHRIFTKPGEICKQPMKLEDVNIAETIMKLHAVCGCDEIFFAESSIKTLLKGQDRDYLLSVDRGELFLSSATDAYKRGTEESAGFLQSSKAAAEKPDTRNFAIHITNRDENVIIGDMVELNGKALLSNLSHHGVAPDRIDAVFSNGATKSYDLWAWAELPTYAKDDIRDYEQHYPVSELSEASNHFSAFMRANEMSCEATNMDTFLPAMNAAFMAAAENPQPDMLRITNDAAKQILARGDADVFKLSAVGAEKLAPIEAARPACFAEHRELAVKQEDISRLDKWAKSAVKNIQRRNGREERKQAKNKEEAL